MMGGAPSPVFLGWLAEKGLPTRRREKKARTGPRLCPERPARKKNWSSGRSENTPNGCSNAVEMADTEAWVCSRRSQRSVLSMTASMTTAEFLSHKKLALVRLSAQSPVMGDMKKELVPKGYDVSVVYLVAGENDPTIDSVKDQVEGAIISVPRSECEAAVREAIEAGIPRLWLQSGCDSKEALALCEEKGVPVVHKACVLMYAEPVQSVHRFHRGIWKVCGLLRD
jgi:hypothetical protein